MKLFIWEGDNVMTDYTNGMVVAIAEDLDSALRAIEAKDDLAMRHFPNKHPAQVVDLDANPKHTEGWVCWGGG